MTLLTYPQIYPIIFLFINTTTYCQRLILTYFIYKQAFQYLDHANCCYNSIYAHVPSKATSLFSLQRISLRISMRYYETTEWENICVKKEYN